MKRLKTKRALSVLLTLTLCLSLFATPGSAAEYAAENPQEIANEELSAIESQSQIEYEPKIYNNATIDQDFDGSSVIVILDKAISEPGKVHDESLFGTFPKVKIESLTRFTDEKPELITDPENFRQMFAIYLPTDDKENVLRVIKELEQIDGIFCAEPNYIGGTGTEIGQSFDPSSGYEPKIYSNVTIDQNFDGDKILVVLDKAISGVNKKHDDSLFGTFEKESITDLTAKENSGTEHKEGFRQIFLIVLPVNDKENVLRAVKELEQIDGIKSAEPCMIGGQAGPVPTPIKYENKIYSEVTLADKFDGSKILVVLDKSISAVNKKHNADFFGNFKKAAVTDLTVKGDNYKQSAASKENFRQIYLIELPQNNKELVLNAVKELEQIDGIKSAEPCLIGGQAGAVPSDPGYINQWALPKIKAPDAWNLPDGSRGAQSVKVGIIDTGIASHVDLNNNLVPGMDFSNSGSTNDTDGHGTHVAGIVGATGDNGIGISGVSWEISLVPLKISITGTPSETVLPQVISAISYAESNNISILNHSWWNFNYSNAFKEAIASYHGIYVCIAGNGNGTNLDNTANYPASFNLPNMIVVGSTNSNDNRSTFSNYGKNSVHLFAPGEDIYSTLPNNTYAYMSGTSMAAPHVAGVAALIKSKYPQLSMTSVKSSILGGTDYVSSLSNLCQTGGRLNAQKALTNAYQYTVMYTISNSSSMYNGTVTASPSSAAMGTIIELTIKPDPGYRLKEGTLKYNGTFLYSVLNGSSFIMPQGNVVISAEFELAPLRNITISSMANGSVISSAATARVGETIELTAIPNAGNFLVKGSMRYNGNMASHYDAQNQNKTRFTMPDENVTITAAFSTVDYGDADGDGVVGLSDATIILRHVAGHIIDINMSNADVNADGSVSLTDVTTVLRFVAGHDVQFGPAA